MALRLGEVAPNFTAMTTEGEINFHDWIGDSWAVLYSHPADFTPVCTTELGRTAALKGEFLKRNAKVSLHFDGYPNKEINVIKIKIIYAKDLTADEMIKEEIERSINPRNLIVITSDSNLRNFARKCSCTIISSEDFSKQIKSPSSAEEESKIIQEMNDLDEFKKLFGV